MKKGKEKNLLYRFTMFVMSCMLAFLLYMINEKRNFINLSQFKLQDLTQFFFWEKLVINDKVAVNNELNYHLLKEHEYSNSTNEVNAILDGVVVKIEEDEVLVLCDNEVSIHYKKINSIKVKENERIKQGSIIGSMNESIILYFYYDNEEITLEEALSI